MGIDDIIKEAQTEGILWSLAVKTEVMKSLLIALGRSEFAEDLVLQGGGAMKFVYGSPRYSVDLDPGSKMMLKKNCKHMEHPVIRHRSNRCLFGLSRNAISRSSGKHWMVIFHERRCRKWT